MHSHPANTQKGEIEVDINGKKVTELSMPELISVISSLTECPESLSPATKEILDFAINDPEKLNYVPQPILFQALQDLIPYSVIYSGKAIELCTRIDTLAPTVADDEDFF